jgi:hypothetical protein
MSTVEKSLLNQLLNFTLEDVILHDAREDLSAHIQNTWCASPKFKRLFGQPSTSALSSFPNSDGHLWVLPT